MANQTLAAPRFTPGEPMPWFRARALGGLDNYVFDTVAGRHVVLLFFGSAGRAEGRAALQVLATRRALFDDEQACFFGVTLDPADEREGRIKPDLPGVRFFLDYDRAISRAFGTAEPEGTTVRLSWMVLDPQLRLLKAFPIDQGAAALALLKERVQREPPPQFAPVLEVDNILEPEMCERLIALHGRGEARPSGFMRDVGGKTVLVFDDKHKKRRDCLVEDEALKQQIGIRIKRRLAPMIERAFAFEASRLERYLVACYDAEDGGHFRAHRDNTTLGTAHRRFAVTINLNAGNYEGGDLRFPEYGRRTYRASTGGAIVFSCSLLHEATPVTRGRRYAFLPFLYDEPAALIREANARHLQEGLGHDYKANKA